MVLAAGLGERMKPLTDTKPKPLVEVAGKALIDHALDRLAAAGVEMAVVNVHHFADALERHLKTRKRPKIVISDERNALLDTGGGIVKALQRLGPEAFLLMNSDSLWLDGPVPNLVRLGGAFDAARMDALLLLAPSAGAIGYRGRGDYGMDAQGRLQRRGEQERAPLVYAGAAVLSPRLFAGVGRYGFARFLSFAAVGRLIWTSAYLGLGYGVGSNIEAASQFLGNMSGLLIALGVLVVAGTYRAGMMRPEAR